MKTTRLYWTAILAVLLPIFAMATDVPSHLQEVSVTIRGAGGEGSGVIFTRTNAAGEHVNFVWTAAHVVDDLRRERSVVAPDGTRRTLVEFDDAKVVKILSERGRIIGKLELDAEVLKYSGIENGEDLALLRLRKRDFLKVSVAFYLEPEIPPLGTDLYHVGSLLGQFGAQSMTSGIYSQHGRLIDKTVYDQVTVVSFPGSSGGGVYLRDGQYVGMLVRGAMGGFSLVVPVRRIAEWAERNNVQWAIDPEAPMPSEAEIRRLPVEDVMPFNTTPSNP